MEERRFADQKIQRRFEAIAQRIRSRPEVFRRRGKVVESWRGYRGRRLGPYYRLVYRDRGRDSAVYLGKSPQLARDLAARGLRLKGFEVRGWRHAGKLGHLLARLAGARKRDGT